MSNHLPTGSWGTNRQEAHMLKWIPLWSLVFSCKRHVLMVARVSQSAAWNSSAQLFIIQLQLQTLKDKTKLTTFTINRKLTMMMLPEGAVLPRDDYDNLQRKWQKLEMQLWQQAARVRHSTQILSGWGPRTNEPKHIVLLHTEFLKNIAWCPSNSRSTCKTTHVIEDE